MRTSEIPVSVRPVLLLLCLAAFALAGCEERAKDVGQTLATVYYLKSWTYIRAEPSPKGKALAKAGPNARMAVLETDGSWSRASFNDGRVVGWVETSRLSDKPVKEPKTPAAAPPSAKSSKSKKAAPEAAKAKETTPEAATEPAASPKAAEPAEEPAQKTTEPVTEPTQVKNDSSVILLSPSEAEAATGPAEAPPAPKKEAKPEAFDPF